MTVLTFTPRPPTATRLRTAADLVEALGIPFSAEQLSAITAPLAPGVIIAGAGSGKTAVMAARVVWLVGTGAVRPEEVLGLTFTRKAAAELSDRVRRALLRAGVVPSGGADESGEQLIMTYDAFAGRLVAEHGLRIGFEADPTMITGATRYRLASRVVTAAAGPFEFISRLRPGTVTERVLRLDADLQQHLVDVDTLDGHARDLLHGLRRGAAEHPGPAVRGRQAGDGRRPGTAGAGQPGPGLPGAEGAARTGRVRRSDGDRRPAGDRDPAGLRAAAVGVPGGPAGRVPGHLRRAGRDVARAVLGA